MNIVEEVLEKQKRDLSKYKPITVEKHLECHLDIGMMLCSDPNDLHCNLSGNGEYVHALTRDNTQLLINAIWELPTERVDESIVAKLPPPSTVLPRLRKVPGPKQLTKWEKFALEKGIKKKKNDKKKYDEVLGKWVPTYGYKRADAEKERDWVMEVPQNVDPNEDMFQKKADLRSEKVAKNEIQRMKNIVRAKKMDVPRAGYMGPEAASASELLRAATIAKASTASVGKFQEKLPKEKMARGKGVKELIPGTKRKSPDNGEHSERDLNLDLVKRILNKKPKYDAEKAISVQKREARHERAELGDGGSGATMTGTTKKKGGQQKKSSKKPKGGRGERAPRKKFSIGRKRR